MQIAILSTSDSMDDSDITSEMIVAVKRSHMEPIVFFRNQPVEKLADFAGYIMIDDTMSAMSEWDLQIPAIREQSKQGKPILGIGHGASDLLLCTGLIPGLENDKPAIHLIDVECIPEEKMAYMSLPPDFQYNAFTRYLNSGSIFPVAVSTKQFVIPPALLLEMQIQGLLLFEYCDAEGNFTGNIVAISNKSGNVMAMMLLPQHAVDGDVIFRSMHDYIKHGYVEQTVPLNYYPR